MSKDKHQSQRGIPPEMPPAPAGSGETPPNHATPRVVEQGDVPRIIDPLDRAPRSGSLARYKIRCDGAQPRPEVRYILAADEASARECYRAAAKLKADDPEIMLAVTRLDD